MCPNKQTVDVEVERLTLGWLLCGLIKRPSH